MNVKAFYVNLWKDYTDITPQAEEIRQLFLKTDSEVINDHVAFRTFSDSPVNLEFLKNVALSMGYDIQEDYDFNVKKLKAISFIHKNANIPKMFISELERHKLSEATQNILSTYCSQIKPVESSPNVFMSGRHWVMPTYLDYQSVLKESEYAAWLLVVGLRANHFTLSVDFLESTNSLQEVLQRVENAGYKINESGGRIKGTPADLLEQGSTMADKMKVQFSGGEVHPVPTCFYEFAKRHKNLDGVLYQGFIAANADKIFESTFLKDDSV